MTQTVFLPEWAPQEAVQLTWPHAQSDWAYMLDEVETCFVRIATAILRHERLIVVAPDSERIFRLLPAELPRPGMPRMPGAHVGRLHAG